MIFLVFVLSYLLLQRLLQTRGDMSKKDKGKAGKGKNAEIPDHLK